MSYREWLYESYRSAFKGPHAPVETARLDELYAAFLSPPPRRALELGAGAGDVVAWLRERGVDAWGIDAAAEQVEAACAHGRDVRRGDLLATLSALAPGEVDALLSLDVLEHLSRDQLVEAALTAGRVLPTGGSFLLLVPNGEALRPLPTYSADLTHETLLSVESISQLFAPAGLRIERVRGVTPGWQKPSRVVRSVLWRAIRAAARAVDLV